MNVNKFLETTFLTPSSVNNWYSLVYSSMYSKAEMPYKHDFGCQTQSIRRVSQYVTLKFSLPDFQQN